MVRTTICRACVGTLFCVLGPAPLAQGQFPSAGHRAAGAERVEENGPLRRTGVALYRGWVLGYEVINGMAVHDGDIVLGTAEEMVAQHRSSRPAKDPAGTWPVRRDISSVEESFLWPGGVIPYVIDPGFDEKAMQDIREGIEEWNSRTVIALVERTTESDFVRFQSGGVFCRAHLGRKGGEQGVWLPQGCGFGAVVHEIGHTVGLHHEHQRVDRDQYIAVPSEVYHGPAYAPVGGPYDYASPMSYPVKTTPLGIPLGLLPHTSIGELSFGDIDGVARLYGRPPTATTISTNPPGLEILVDGEPIATPVTFDWSPGSKHTLAALSPQTVGHKRFVFGRWNDGATNLRTVTASSERTWFEANYIVQHRLLACANPPEAGEVRVRPESADGYYTVGMPIEVEAVPAGGRTFVRWDVGYRLRPPAVYSGQTELFPGESPNPAAGEIPFQHPAGSEYVARFAAEPVFLIASEVDGFTIFANGEPKRLPWAFPAGAYPNGLTVEAFAVVPEAEAINRWDDVRYRFDGWSDGGGRIHQVPVPAAGGRISLNVTPEYRLRVRARGGNGTAVSISPPSEDGFYREGTQVVVTATPPPGMHFAGWTGGASGSDSTLTVVMDAAKSVEAIFEWDEPLRPSEEREMALDAIGRFKLYPGGYVLVPRDAAEMTVRFQATTAAEVDLYVRRGAEVRSEMVDASATPRIHADFASTAPGANETITISRESAPPLTNDVFYIALGAPPTGRTVRGKLSVEIGRSGIVRAWPSALTFDAPSGSDPDSQTVQLTHQTASPVRFRVDSNRSWLRATPQEWVQTGSGAAEIAVTVNSAGLANGTHRGELTVEQVTGAETQGVTVNSAGPANGESKTAGIAIPVVFAVVPDNAGTSGIRRVNGARITSRPVRGDTYEAGDAIEVEVDLVDQAKVTGSPTLPLEVGSRMRQMAREESNYSGPCGDGYTVLRFRYVVQADDVDADGVSIPGDDLDLNGGGIVTANGTAAILAIAPVDGGPSHKVDGSRSTPPAVDNLSIGSRPQDGQAYGAGERISLTLVFSQPVEVTGTPTLKIGMGSQTRQASMSTWWGERGVLWFGYVVQSGDRDPDGISIAADALDLNGGSIRNVAGLDADLDLGGYAIVNAAAHSVDGGE